VSDIYFVEDQRSPVPTPVPTPTSTPTQSMSQHVSPPSTPELSQTANLVQLPPAEAALPTAEAAESLTDDAGDFPSYHGVFTVCLFFCLLFSCI